MESKVSRFGGFLFFGNTVLSLLWFSDTDILFSLENALLECFTCEHGFDLLTILECLKISSHISK